MFKDQSSTTAHMQKHINTMIYILKNNTGKKKRSWIYFEMVSIQKLQLTLHLKNNYNGMANKTLN